jgi:hypothetical protein
MRFLKFWEWIEKIVPIDHPLMMVD